MSKRVTFNQKLKDKIDSNDINYIKTTITDLNKFINNIFNNNNYKIYNLKCSTQFENFSNIKKWCSLERKNYQTFLYAYPFSMFVSELKKFYWNKYNYDINNNLGEIKLNKKNELSEESFNKLDIFINFLNRDLYFLEFLWTTSKEIEYNFFHFYEGLNYVAKSYGYVYDKEAEGIINSDLKNIKEIRENKDVKLIDKWFVAKSFAEKKDVINDIYEELNPQRDELKKIFGKNFINEIFKENVNDLYRHQKIESKDDKGNIDKIFEIMFLMKAVLENNNYIKK